MKHFSTRFIGCLNFVSLVSSLMAQAQAQAQGIAVVGMALSPARNAVAAPRTAPVVVPFLQAIAPATAGNI